MKQVGQITIVRLRAIQLTVGHTNLKLVYVEAEESSHLHLLESA